MSSRLDISELRGRSEMINRFSSGPKQNPYCDRRANRNRKPIPKAHQRLCIGAANSNARKPRFPESSATNCHTKHDRKKCATAKEPPKLIQNPRICVADRCGKASSHFDTIDDLVGGPEIQDDRGEQQQKRRPENKVVQIREQTPAFRIMTRGFRRH